MTFSIKKLYCASLIEIMISNIVGDWMSIPVKSSMHHKGYGLQLGSLTILASRFSRLAETELDSNRQIQINRCMDIVNKTINAKIRLKEAENAFN